MSVTASTVTFRTKEGRSHSVTPIEFLRRFVQHVLPDGFKKIRHYGLYAGSGEGKLEHARAGLATESARPAGRLPARTWQDLLRELTGRDVDRCPCCGGVLERIPLERRTARGPPLAEAS